MRSARFQIIASGIVFALLSCSVASAQDPPLPPAAADENRKSEPGKDQSPKTEPLPADSNVAPEPSQPPSDQLPDSPGAMQNRPSDPPTASNSSQVRSPSEPDPSATPIVANAEPTPQTPPQQPPREPLGTAAAESVPTVGVAASRPAGAAVAPAKQRRVRSILIKVGALVGAGVAIGTTMALSQGSPSKPPGSR